MKRIFLILAAFLLLAACQPTPDQPIVVQKDTERLVDTVLHQSPEGTAPTDAMTDAPGFVKSDEHYAYDYQSGNGRLTIHADADVYLPASGRISMARVCESGFSDEWVKTAFDRIFQGETAYSTFGGHAPSKADIARDIAYYQELLDSGRLEEEKEMDEDEALALIEELKEQYNTAPDERTEIPPEIADGSVKTQTNDTEIGTTVNRRMLAYNDAHSVTFSEFDNSVGIPLGSNFTYNRGTWENALSFSGGLEGYTIENWYKPYQRVPVYADEKDCRCGQQTSPADAVQACKDFLAMLDVTDVTPCRRCTLYTATVDDRVKSLYIIHLVRTAAGSPVAYVPLIQGESYNKFSLPWMYEQITFFVDDEGVLLFDWYSPVKVKEVLSTDVQTIPFEEAARIFENMCCITYEAQTTKTYNESAYFDLYADEVELSMIRIREQNSEAKTGLYVPAWVFYGKVVKQYGEHRDLSPDGYATVILFAINAVDGSIIDVYNGF